MPNEIKIIVVGVPESKGAEHLFNAIKNKGYKASIVSALDEIRKNIDSADRSTAKPKTGDALTLEAQLENHIIDFTTKLPSGDFPKTDVCCYTVNTEGLTGTSFFTVTVERKDGILTFQSQYVNDYIIAKGHACSLFIIALIKSLYGHKLTDIKLFNRPPFSFEEYVKSSESSDVDLFNACIEEGEYQNVKDLVIRAKEQLFDAEETSNVFIHVQPCVCECKREGCQTNDNYFCVQIYPTGMVRVELFNPSTKHHEVLFSGDIVDDEFQDNMRSFLD